MEEITASGSKQTPGKRKLAGVMTGAFLLAVIVVVVALLPAEDICTDDVRGYEREASSSLSALRTKLRAIEASATTGEIRRVPQLEGLNPGNFAALRACDAQCKLLRQCLRFVFFTPPSEACPTEYTDYRATTTLALTLLEDLHRLQLTTERAADKADQLERARENVEDIEQASGSTGGRLAVLKRQVHLLEEDLAQDFSSIEHQINALLPQEDGGNGR